MKIAAKALSRSSIASLLGVPFAVLVFVSVFDPAFPNPADPENYYSHSVGWIFVGVIVIISFTNNRFWQVDERRPSVLWMRLLLGVCVAAVVLDVIGDVLVPAFILRTRVDNVVAAPAFFAVPVSIIALIGGFVAAWRSKPA